MSELSNQMERDVKVSSQVAGDIMGVCACVLSHFSHVQLLVTLWTEAHQVPLSMGFSRQEYWSGLPCPPPVDAHLSRPPGIKFMLPVYPDLQVDSSPTEPPGKPNIMGSQQIFINWIQTIPLTQFNVKVPHFSYESQETLLEDFGKG